MILQENVWNSHSQPSLCIKITGVVEDIVFTCPSFGDRGLLFLLGAASLPLHMILGVKGLQLCGPTSHPIKMGLQSNLGDQNIHPLDIVTGPELGT